MSQSECDFQAQCPNSWSALAFDLSQLREDTSHVIHLVKLRRVNHCAKWDIGGLIIQVTMER